MTEMHLQDESIYKYMTQFEATQLLAGQSVIPIPSHEDVARRAYEIYIKHGCRPGQCKQNWQQAENDLRENGALAATFTRVDPVVEHISAGFWTTK